MVMGTFGTVSEELGKAEMGCHGLVIVLEKRTVASHGKMNREFKNQGTLKDQRVLSEDCRYNKGVRPEHLPCGLPLTFISSTTNISHLFHDPKFLKREKQKTI